MQDTQLSPSRSLLCIAANEYASAPSLDFCVSDAIAVADVLVMPEFGFDQQVLLLNDHAIQESSTRCD